MRLIDVGDRAVAVILDAADAANLPARVGELARRLAECLPEGVTDVVASPGRVTVIYDPLRMPDLALLRSWIGPRATAQADATQPAAASHEIPVCYGGGLGPCLGPDLAEVCDLHGIDRDRLVALHAGADYVVEAIGFMPGFGYLAGLPAELATPRRSTPRRVVPAGSVGIGAGQTGAYPFASPGGWNLIGATPHGCSTRRGTAPRCSRSAIASGFGRSNGVSFPGWLGASRNRSPLAPRPADSPSCDRACAPPSRISDGRGTGPRACRGRGLPTRGPCGSPTGSSAIPTRPRRSRSRSSALVSASNRTPSWRSPAPSFRGCRRAGP